MQKPSLAAMAKALQSAPLADLPALEITVLRNVVLEPIEIYLRYLALEIGHAARCHFGQYDNVFQEAVGGAPDILNDRTGCVLVFLKLETLAWDLARTPIGLDPAQLAAEKSRVADYVAAVISGIRKQTPALILCASFERPLYPALGVLDATEPAGQTAAVDELNRHVREVLRQTPSAYLLDLNVCLARLGSTRFYDQRYWHIGKAPYTRDALEEVAHEVFRFIRPLKGKSKKCLVLDCDGVLWGGILGEEGLAGIKLGSTYPGSMYRELQQELHNLHRRGILLALCSRNNEADVWEVFDRHPEMLLRREHIATAQINWRDKATNIRQIALDLNIGLDALVFLDDSEFEASLVRELLPEVHVVQLPKDRAVQYREIVASLGWCDSLSISREDGTRTAMYQVEQVRQRLRAESSDLDAYYASLGMVLTIRRADSFAIPRVAQLTQKTNQFNLTTRRYSEAEVKALTQRGDRDVVSARLNDRFGDMGIVGVCILEYKEDEVEIDSLLLSCRALGRGVEDAFIVRCLRHAGARGARRALAEYRRSAKNSQVESFYPRHGFTLTSDDGDCRRYAIDLTGLAGSEPQFFARIDSDLDDPGSGRSPSEEGRA